MGLFITGPLDDSASQSVGTTSVEVLERNRGRRYLFIQNIHSTAVIWVRFGEGNAAVAGAAGNVRLASGASLIFETGWVPSSEVNIISDTAATPVTVLEGD